VERIFVITPRIVEVDSKNLGDYSKYFQPAPLQQEAFDEEAAFNLPVEEVFKQVRASVRRESNNQQTPWENTALEGQFFFKAPVQLASAAANSGSTAARPAGPDMVAVDLAFWEMTHYLINSTPKSTTI
jgi:hypothetical protein